MTREFFYDPTTILLVHGAAVQVHDEALLFLGPSGAGKSTICRLFSDVAQILADDATYLLLQPENRWAVGNMIPGRVLPEQEIVLLGGITLRAVFRLYQAAQPSIESITALETCRYLTHALFEAGFYHRQTNEVKRRAFSHAAAVARSVPGYHLYFDLSPRTLETLFTAVS